MVRGVAAYESGLVRTAGRRSLLLAVPDRATARVDAVLRAIGGCLRHRPHSGGARGAARQSRREVERLADRCFVGGGIPGFGGATRLCAHGITIDHCLRLRFRDLDYFQPGAVAAWGERTVDHSGFVVPAVGGGSTGAAASGGVPRVVRRFERREPAEQRHFLCYSAR